MSFKVKLARTGSGIGMWDRKEHLGVLLLVSFLALLTWVLVLSIVVLVVLY